MTVGLAIAVVGLASGKDRALQLADNLRAAEWTLADDERAALDRASARPLPYPYWHAERFNRERMPPE